MEPTPPDLPPEPERKLPGWAIVLMVVGGVIVIAGGICVALVVTL
jgi:hypothetical protein